MPKRNKQGKGPAKGPPKKKVKVFKKPTRQKWTCEQKILARDLKKEGKKPHEIIKIIKEKYDVEVKPSTLATWYNTKNMATHEQRGPRNTSMASVETHVNPAQRPTIMIDMEFALVSMMKKANNIGSVTKKGALKKMGICIFNKLRALNIYDDPGERLRPLSELNEDRMNTLLTDASKDRFPCPICEAPVRSGGDYLLVHIQNYHTNQNDEQIQSPPGGNEFTFKGSDGWVRNFLDRHNMHNVLIVGEMGSNNQEAAKDYVDNFRDELIQRGISPRKIVNVLLNIDETGIVYKSVPKRTYKFIGTPFMAKKSLKDRVTVLVGASMGGFKLKPVVIGKAQRPRALRGVDMDQLPVHYYGQESSWMSQEIMHHWFLFHLDHELKEHYGDNTDVILTIDNAGCHPPDLNNLLDYVEVRYLPPNTTAVIQPMDQGVIHVFKRNYLDIYYNKMIDYLLLHGIDDDPMNDFTTSYTMKDVLLDIGEAWSTVEATHIHKCFEKLINPEDYVNKYNETHNTDVQWPGVNFRGFQDPDDDNSAAERADKVNKIKELVSKLHSRMSHLPEERRVTIDWYSVSEAIDYDPNDDLEDTSELIQLGFHSQREAEGLESEENDLVPDISHKKREALKALANIKLYFHTEDFKSKEVADQASTHLKALHEIFLEMKDPTASTIHTPPRPSSRAPSPEPSTSGVSTIIRPSRVSPVPAENLSLSLEELGIVHVSLDEDPEVPASPSAASSSASPSAASPSAADMDDKSNTSDVDLDVFHGFGEADARESAASAAAAAAASATRYLDLSTASSYEDDDGNTVLLSKFTALNPSATSSPRTTGRTSPVATSSPSPTQPIDRPRRTGVRQSTCMYTEVSFDDISTSGDEEYIPKQK